jgi:AraC-like DNA-binding protein
MEMERLLVSAAPSSASTADIRQEREEMTALLLEQLDILLRRAREQVHLSEIERLVGEAERLLQRRSSGPVTIQQIAGELGVSSSSLRAQFVRLRGQTPSAHLQSVRVQHALALLRNSSAPLQAIAHACGYDSASHLSRHVKRATGTSPGALRTR